MPRRVCVFGAESTGKTTLARDLAAHFRAPWVPEFARAHCDARGGVLGPEDAPVIVAGQAAAEEAAAATLAPGALLFCDTDALSSVIWCDLLYGGCPADMRAHAESRARRYALYLLCEPDVPFVPDPQRCFPDPAARLAAAAHWESALQRLDLPFVRIRGADWPTRFQLAVTAVTSLRG